MSGAQQVTFMNQRSFDPPAFTVIGGPSGGGFWAGDISTTANSVATHHIVIGPRSTAQSVEEMWKDANTATSGTTSVIDGPGNTATIVADGNSTVYPAAHFCNDLVLGGFSDWYLPAKNELEICYFNLKPSTTSNNTSAPGTNANAVPARASNYTAGNPAQTSAVAFQSGGAQTFDTENYWSSTSTTTTGAHCQIFVNGYQYSDKLKRNTFRTRAIRRVAI